MGDTARDIAVHIASQYPLDWCEQGRLAHSIVAALTAYGDARLEEAAKVAEDYEIGARSPYTAQRDIVAAIRALASKEPT